jgi:hypothetical protein
MQLEMWMERNAFQRMRRWIPNSCVGFAHIDEARGEEELHLANATSKAGFKELQRQMRDRIRYDLTQRRRDQPTKFPTQPNSAQ